MQATLALRLYLTGTIFLSYTLNGHRVHGCHAGNIAQLMSHAFTALQRDGHLQKVVSSDASIIHSGLHTAKGLWSSLQSTGLGPCCFSKQHARHLDRRPIPAQFKGSKFSPGLPCFITTRHPAIASVCRRDGPCVGCCHVAWRHPAPELKLVSMTWKAQLPNSWSAPTMSVYCIHDAVKHMAH